MKQFAFITGSLSFSISAMGMLFKILHLQGAAVLLGVGILVFSFLFVPSTTKYLYDKV